MGEVCDVRGCVGIEMRVMGIGIYLALLMQFFGRSDVVVVFAGGLCGLCRVALVAAVAAVDRW